MDLSALPGAELIEQGLEDLGRGLESVPALLMAIGSPRLRRLGLAVPAFPFEDPEHRLYAVLAREDSDGAHSRYNALLRRLVSLEGAAERGEPLDADRAWAFIRGLGRGADTDTRVYLTGGISAVLLGWRNSTIDADIHLVPGSSRLFDAIARLKNELSLNVELACPADFIPELPGWRDRSPFIVREGLVSFHHYDFYAQALAKIERGHAQDRGDVKHMLAEGLVEPARLRQLFEEIQPGLLRYPAVDPASFRRALEATLS